mmetsp:Transcript_102550/g.289636  ORF Transcript_102550/g.289636 Transcript_102550/m.289636 type:complete len:326 (-) Transcript_102550:95-1072(-)
MSADAWAYARGVLSLAVPLFPGEPIPFGPWSVQDVLVSLAVSSGACAAAGYCLTRSRFLVQLASRVAPDLRDEALEELSAHFPEQSARCEDSLKARPDDAEACVKPSRRPVAKRFAAELLFITVHNSTVATLAALSWLLGSPYLALLTFNLEVGYEIFDTISLGFKRMEPETLIHHVVSPICIICSTQTEVDFRVLCHLCICIDVSGAVLGYCKFLLRYSHVSSVQIYRNLVWIYGLLRVALPLIDTVIIVRNCLLTRGGVFGVLAYTQHADGKNIYYARTDWTQLYFWAMAVLDAFNIYFFIVIRTRAKMPPQVVAHLEQTGCH